MHKRSKFELYGDILVAVKFDIQKNLSARLTRVYGRSNVPYDRFKTYIEELRENNLIDISTVQGHEEIKLTSRGIEYIEEYSKVNKFLKSFGLQEKFHDLE